MNLKSRGVAEATAIQALGFLADDPERLDGFLFATGLTPAGMRDLAGEPEFLRGVVEHILSDEAMLLAFCRETGRSSREVWMARQVLGGAPTEWG